MPRTATQFLRIAVCKRVLEEVLQMKLKQSKLDDNNTPVGDGDDFLSERPGTELHKDPPALRL